MSTQNLADELKKRSAWSIFMGVLTAALGVFLLVYPLATATITTVLLGWVLIFVGIALFVFALHSQTVGNFLLKILLSLLYGICGIALAFFPVAGVGALTLMLGTLLLIQAGMLTAIAFQLKPVEGWGWFLADGATSLLLSVLIFAKWPSSAIWTIGALVGMSVLMSGISRIMIATKIRSGAATIERLSRAA